LLLRLPSNQKPYDAFYWRDPAFHQPPEPPADDADEETKEAWRKAYSAHVDRMKAARETGQWPDVTIEGKQPTKFVMRPIPGNTSRRLEDRLLSGSLGANELNALAFRIGIQQIENLGGGTDYKVKFTEHPEFGVIATEDVVNMLDAIQRGIVNDLGNDAFDRSRGPSQK
jgi:hypothetical protein